MLSSSNAENIVTDFINSFSTGDLETMRNLLSEDVISHITNAEAMAKTLNGRSAFMSAVPCDLASVKPQVSITQMLSVKYNQILVMVEVKAQRKGKKLHNHAAYLMAIKDEKIHRIWMVDALPAYSDEFWKN